MIVSEPVAEINTENRIVMGIETGKVIGNGMDTARKATKGTSTTATDTLPPAKGSQSLTNLATVANAHDAQEAMTIPTV